MNFQMRKRMEIFEFGKSIYDSFQDLCTTQISSIPGTSAPCQASMSAGEVLLEGIVFSVHLILDISEQIYAEVVDVQDGDYEDDRHQTTYENVITNNGNIITTFYATQQLKVMLGEISDGIANIEEDLEEEEQRRRLNEIDCVNVTGVGWKLGCTNVTCEDPARLCDGSYNFPYIAYLKGGELEQFDNDASLLLSLAASTLHLPSLAGCDDLDSDGDAKQ